ncbi:MAG: hypothetical protein EOP56_06665 [Sphingobacteriales bacterium]|nr:MAG: hypothetical protein EOP56_06665 [Sphingobacteriales bacterium]
MAKFRVEFDNKKIKSIQPTEQEVPSNDTFLEERTGQTMWAIISADNEEEAREKAGRLETELQTGRTKEDLTGGNPGD